MAELWQFVKGIVKKMKQTVRLSENRIKTIKRSMDYTCHYHPRAIAAHRRRFKKILEEIHMGDCRHVVRTCKQFPRNPRKSKRKPQEVREET